MGQMATIIEKLNAHLGTALRAPEFPDTLYVMNQSHHTVPVRVRRSSL